METPKVLLVDSRLTFLNLFMAVLMELSQLLQWLREAAGAGLSTVTVLILGFANLIADGFSMAVGAYLSAKTEDEAYQKTLDQEYWEVENIPDVERQEIREIYQAKGFEGDLLEQVVDTICADKDRWVDDMMKSELFLFPSNKQPIWVALWTFISFNLVGVIPLTVYIWHATDPAGLPLFQWSAGLTALAFMVIGYLKAKVNGAVHLPQPCGNLVAWCHCSSSRLCSG